MYKYDEENNWLVDGDGKIICQFWNKFEDDYHNSKSNGKKVEAALNTMEAQATSTNSRVMPLPQECCKCKWSPQFNELAHCTTCTVNYLHSNFFEATS